MNLAEINIDCLRAAESLLRDHDARIAAATEELKLLRRDRVVIAERVQACIDVLCGRATPDLFTSAAVPPTPAEVGPVVTHTLPPPADPNGPDAWRLRPWTDLGVKNTVILKTLGDSQLSEIGEIEHALRMNRTPFGLSEYQANHLCALIDDVATGDPSYNRLLVVEAVPTAKANEVPVHGDAKEWANVGGAARLVPAAAPPPPVLLRDIPGITAADADDLGAVGLRTVADLEGKVDALGGYEWKTLNMKVYKVLLVPKGPLLGPDADRVANAVEKYMSGAVEPEPDATPRAKGKGGKRAKAKAVPDVKGGSNRKKAKAAG